VPVPTNPKLYHITHVDNLASILEFGELFSDAALVERGGPSSGVGMSAIKQRRLSLPVKCHSGDFVGDYVPFYFCPRSVMLYVIHCANHPGLTYRGGQDPIVHLEADLHEVIDWTKSAGRRWAFSLQNAGAAYAEFRKSRDELNQVNWAAVEALDFRDPAIKEGKQAEFLVHRSLPFELVELIGARTYATVARVRQSLATAGVHKRVELKPEWYY
jgi:hypothetical protein